MSKKTSGFPVWKPGVAITAEEKLRAMEAQRLAIDQEFEEEFKDYHARQAFRDELTEISREYGRDPKRFLSDNK